MNNKTLGTLALIGAPFMWLGMHLEGTYGNLSNSWFTGVWGLLFISGWFCSIIALRRMQATGQSKFGKGILSVIMGTLVLSNLSNVYQLLLPKDKSPLFIALDAFWPISNLIMLAVGIAVIASRGLSGWRCYVPLLVGCWFPLAMVSRVLLGNWLAGFPVVGLYSAVAWTLLAVVVLTSRSSQSVIRQGAYAEV